MSTILPLVRLGVLGLACAGNVLELHLRRHIPAAFCLAILFSGVICLLFLGGLLNIMPHMLTAIVLLGIFLAAYVSIKYAEKFFTLSNVVYFEFEIWLASSGSGVPHPFRAVRFPFGNRTALLAGDTPQAPSCGAFAPPIKATALPAMRPCGRS